MRRPTRFLAGSLTLVMGALLTTTTAGSRERPSPALSTHPIDRVVQAALRAEGLRAAPLCTDEVFLRRVHLDVLGTLPTAEEAEAFLRKRGSNRRSELVDALLARPEFVDHATMRWGDWLRVKSEFPINLWPNAVQAYHRWIHDALRENRPYDEIVRELLTASGSNFRVPAVNFHRAVQSREPEALAQAVALTFMGTRTEHWEPERRAAMATFFSYVSFKSTLEWKEEIVLLDPRPRPPLRGTLPDGSLVPILPDQDPRQVFADWLIRPDNEWFARSAVNRVFAWLLGRGIVHEPDDLRPDNPPSVPELLEVLEKEFVRTGYDLRALYRFILCSRTYQRSAQPVNADHERAAALFAHAQVRRLDAEILMDALCRITGSTESYSSPTPEPYTYVPESERSIALQDGSITSPFLEMFGRPSRDTGLWSERDRRPTQGQLLHLLNSSDVQNRIRKSPVLSRILARARGNEREALRELYLLVLSRPPTREEMDLLPRHAREAGLKPEEAATDLIWALLNSKEFLHRH